MNARTRVATVGTLLALAAALSGCGSEDGGSGASGGNPFGTSSAANDTPTMVVTETVTAAPTADPTQQNEPEQPTEPAQESTLEVPTQAAVEPTEATGGQSGTVSGGDPGSSPTSFAQAVARVRAAGTPRAGLMTFQTPSGNIYCDLGQVAVGCEIGEGAVADGTCPAGGGPDRVGRIEFQEDGMVAPVCNGDTIRDGVAPSVAYGTAVSGPGLTCVVEEAGVTCVDSDELGAGFTLRKGHYAVWNVTS